MPERALPLYRKANELQPGIDLFQANLAACAVYLGLIDEAREIYQRLLRLPGAPAQSLPLVPPRARHRHAHVEQMQAILRPAEPATRQEHVHVLRARQGTRGPRALGRGVRVLPAGRRCRDAGRHYELAEDLALIDRIIEVCDAAGWPRKGLAGRASCTRWPDAHFRDRPAAHRKHAD
jgi:tetratricopeptide (TPR) repeat protein